MSKISNMDKIYKELFGDSDTESSVDDKMRNINTKKLTKKIKMDENNNMTEPKSKTVSKSSKNSTDDIKSSNLKTDGKKSESKRKREDDLVKTSKKPRTDDNSLIKTEIKDEHSTINEKSSTKFKKSEKSEIRISKMTANQPENNLLKKEVKSSNHKKSKDDKSSKNEKTKKDSKETSKSEKSSRSENSSKNSKSSQKSEKSTRQSEKPTRSSMTTEIKKVKSENVKEDSKSSQKSENSKTTSSSKSSEIKKDSKDRVKSEKTKDLKQSKNSESTTEIESSKSTKKSATKISEKSSKTEKPSKIKEKSTKQEKVKKTSSKSEAENIHIQPQAEVIVQKIPENVIKTEETSKVTFQVPAKIESTPQTVPLFSLPKRIEESSQYEDKELDEKLMRLYGSYQKSTSFLHISQKIEKNPQQVIQPKPAVNIQEVLRVPKPAPTRINQNRLPKRKLEEMSENSTEMKFTATKPENFKFNRENPKAFGSSSVPTQPQTSVERLKEAFKIPTIPKKEPVKPNAFQRRLMNMNSIKSSIKKCNQVTWQQNETSTQQEPKRFKDIETELLFAKIEEFYKIPEMVQPIEDHPSELHPRQVKQPEIINSWYTVENSFLMSPPTKENARRSSLKMKIRKVSMENEGVGKQSERLIDSNLRKMIDNYAANIENLVNGIGI